MISKKSDIFRFLDYVEADDGCWDFGQAKDSDGYSVFQIGAATKRKAHRIAYELFVGEIPPGHQIHHVCGNRWCVRFDHLKAVSPKEHSAAHRVMTCKRGHDFTPENTYVFAATGKRMCRACARLRRKADSL